MIRTLLISAALLAGIASASAHATLDRASPPVGSTVAQAPSQLTLTFTENRAVVQRGDGDERLRPARG